MENKVMYAIYTRKFVEEECPEEVSSCKAQALYCRKFAQDRNILLSENVYEDYGKSSGTIERLAFQQLLKDIEKGEIGGVLVHKLDRLTRSFSDFMGVIPSLQKI